MERSQKIDWKALSEAAPDQNIHPRVLVYVEGFDAHSPQIFDVKTSQLYDLPTGPDDIDNLAFGATHWAPLPVPVLAKHNRLGLVLHKQAA